ncbi:MAG TPA: hypothetical protein VI136_02645 [Verrucomicrobiae bacterium]
MREDGTLVAWGAQQGYGNSVPTNLAGVKAIDSGWYHNLALKTNGTVVARRAGRGRGRGAVGQSPRPACRQPPPGSAPRTLRP